MEWTERKDRAGDRRDQRSRPRNRAEPRRRGANVAVNYRSSAEEAEALVGEIAATGGKANAYRADVADFAAVKAMVDTIVKDFGGLNILINNAGLAIRQRFVETKPEDGVVRSTPAFTARSLLHAADSISTPPKTAASSASSAIPRASVNPGWRSSPPPVPAWWR